MELKDLVGEHVLTGVDFTEEKSTDTWGADISNVCRFVLDGIIYTAIEDPEDGWRSSMKELVVGSAKPMTNTFEAHRVVCSMRDAHDDDILVVVDAVTGKTVLEVGTSSVSDWYPCFVSDYHPENLAANANVPAILL